MVQHDKRGRPLLSEIYASQRDALIDARRREMLDELAWLEREVRPHPANPDMYASIARLHRESGGKDAALAALRKGIAACPAASGLYWQLANTLNQHGRTEEAAAVAASAVRKAPQGLQF